MIYIVAQVYRSAITISDIRTFTEKQHALDYKIEKMRVNPHETWRVWESMPNSKTFVTKAVK